MMPAMPEWDVPENLEELLDSDGDGIWEDKSWLPISVTVMKGTSYRGRDIPLAWQIEFEPENEAFEVPNNSIQNLGVDPDGYGWCTVIQNVISKDHPEIVGELHFGDTETGTCVIWVESEKVCRILVETVWSLIHG